jgi:translation initiation factor 1
MSNHRLVYSTESGRVCPDCGRAPERCGCKKPSPQTPPPFPADGIVRIRRETQGRNGKTVSAIYGLGPDTGALEVLARLLKQRCGTGGAIKDGTIVIQGDHRDRIRETLEARGYKVKMSGG